MTVTDHAAALFFRAVARDRHPTPGCTASQTLRGYEKCFSLEASPARARRGDADGCGTRFGRLRDWC
jgi:hypothetical protein